MDVRLVVSVLKAGTISWGTPSFSAPLATLAVGLDDEKAILELLDVLTFPSSLAVAFSTKILQKLLLATPAKCNTRTLALDKTATLLAKTLARRLLFAHSGNYPCSLISDRTAYTVNTNDRRLWASSASRQHSTLTQTACQMTVTAASRRPELKDSREACPSGAAAVDSLLSQRPS